MATPKEQKAELYLNLYFALLLTAIMRFQSHMSLRDTSMRLIATQQESNPGTDTKVRRKSIKVYLQVSHLKNFV